MTEGTGNDTENRKQLTILMNSTFGHLFNIKEEHEILDVLLNPHGDGIRAYIKVMDYLTKYHPLVYKWYDIDHKLYDLESTTWNYSNALTTLYIHLKLANKEPKWLHYKDNNILICRVNDTPNERRVGKLLPDVDRFNCLRCDKPLVWGELPEWSEKIGEEIEIQYDEEKPPIHHRETLSHGYYLYCRNTDYSQVVDSPNSNGAYCKICETQLIWVQLTEWEGQWDLRDEVKEDKPRYSHYRLLQTITNYDPIDLVSMNSDLFICESGYTLRLSARRMFTSNVEDDKDGLNITCGTCDRKFKWHKLPILAIKSPTPGIDLEAIRSIGREAVKSAMPQIDSIMLPNVPNDMSIFDFHELSKKIGFVVDSTIAKVITEIWGGNK